MAMKKKFLGLALAAAVAFPVTNAYANTATVTGNETDTLNHNVTVTGTVKNADGEAPAGKIEVELPTAMAFAVDQNGTFTGADYTVTNKSQEAIRLSVSEFRETDTNGGIELMEKGSITTDSTRDQVSLMLEGRLDGVVTSVDLAEVAKNGQEQQVLDVEGGNAGTLKLNGQAGTAKTNQDVEDNGASEEFTLVFKINKK